MADLLQSLSAQFDAMFGDLHVRPDDKRTPQDRIVEQRAEARRLGIPLAFPEAGELVD